jgi:hypothetical protein
VVQIEVERAMAALEQSDLAGRGEAGANLLRVINHLVSVHLMHMNREETEIMATLWAGMVDPDLGALRMRMADSLPAERRLVWRGLLEGSISPVERRLVLGAPLG